MALIGGPELGYYSDMTGFLAKLAGDATLDKTNFSATRTSNSFVVESKLENVDRVELTSSDLVELQKHVVLCHDDLEPRNILIKRDNANSGKWNIAAIIDWEMAGFFPFAYEYGHKDAMLGSSNLHFSYYTLFKEQSQHLLAGGKSAIRLLEALRAMDVSKKSRPTKNVSRCFQARWLEREMVELSSDVQVGWVPRAGAGDVGVFTKQENEDLEMEILKELGYVSLKLLYTIELYPSPYQGLRLYLII
ncbi:Aminoglycoside phosphotransferase [Fusarium oxysporum f. sp. vasinfectum]|nr:Aminoglycoside phosphotransferase [Fusarium oxysporum f. sp. vasinfectum]